MGFRLTSPAQVCRPLNPDAMWCHTQYALLHLPLVSDLLVTMHKLFGRHLGMNVTTDKMFHRVIEEAYPHITDMLDEVCELGKEEMKSLPSDKLGSWQRAVTTSDGCWHIRGFFSQNGTFVIRNWLSGALLRYGHACMRGSDLIITDELYQEQPSQ